MKKLYLIFVIIGILGCNNEEIFEPQEQACDNGTYVGNIALFSQQEVDDFGALCYTKIDGTLTIGSLGDDTSDIVDLSSLSSLTEIFSTTPATSTGSLRINAYNLPSLNGLQNIENVTNLYVERCAMLTDLSGLEGLTRIDQPPGLNRNRLIISGNDNLISLDGLENLWKIEDDMVTDFGTGVIYVYGNDSLTNIDGLSGLLEVYGNIYFAIQCGILDGDTCGNLALVDFCGIQNLFINGIYGNLRTGGAMYEGFSPTIEDIQLGNCSQ